MPIRDQVQDQRLLIEPRGGKAMDVNQQAIAAMRAITISREYGSGGGEIAARLARRLGWRLIDHAVIEQTARELEVYETEVEKHDEEYVESTLSRILNRIQHFAPAAFTSAGGSSIFASYPQASGKIVDDALDYQVNLSSHITVQ